MSGNIIYNTCLIPLDDVYYVAKNGKDNNCGSQGDPFLTIQAAIDYASVKSAGINALIKILPGTYTEQIKSYSNLFLEGDAATCPVGESKLTTIYNTGADAAHYPLCGDDGCWYNIKDCNIQTDTNGTFGKLTQSRYTGCRFSGGYFIEGTEDIAVYATWCSCSFINCKGFNLTGVAPNGRYLVFEKSWWGYHQTPVFESTHTTGNAVFDMDGGHLAFTYLSLKGDWYHFAKNYHSFGLSRHTYGTTKGVAYRNVTISNGIHFEVEPQEFRMVNCTTEDAAECPLAAGNADITSDVTVTNVEFQNNSMHNGLCGCIQIAGPDRNLGGNSSDRYMNLECAVMSIPDEGVIHLHESYSDLDKIVLNTGANVSIDGQRIYGLTFSGGICDIGDNQALHIHRCPTVTGTKIVINGENACVCFKACSDLTLNVTATSGTGSKFTSLSNCFYGSTGNPVLSVANVDTEYLIEYSFMRGATGQPAVSFTVEADNKLEAKFSSFIHGDNSSNSPMTYNGVASKMDLSLYNCGLNAVLSADKFTNEIGSANNTVDSNLNF